MGTRPTQPPVRGASVLRPSVWGPAARACHGLHVVTQPPELPPSFQYWRDRELAWKLAREGVSSFQDLALQVLLGTHATQPESRLDVVSVAGADRGFDATLVESAIAEGCKAVRLRCLETDNRAVPFKEQRFSDAGITRYVSTRPLSDGSWPEPGTVSVCIANYSLQHLSALEGTIRRIHDCLTPDGVFALHASVGRNGRLRWPEAIEPARAIWEAAPLLYKYDHLKERLQEDFQDSDLASAGEDVRTQDLLPLLMRHFRFELFIAFGNIIDLFIDRRFGPNFDIDDPVDRRFLQRVAELDDLKIDTGVFKPTHVVALARKSFDGPPRVFRHWDPAFCLRVSGPTDLESTIRRRTSK